MLAKKANVLHTSSCWPTKNADPWILTGKHRTWSSTTRYTCPFPVLLVRTAWPRCFLDIRIGSLWQLLLCTLRNPLQTCAVCAIVNQWPILNYVSLAAVHCGVGIRRPLRVQVWHRLFYRRPLCGDMIMSHLAVDMVSIRPLTRIQRAGNTLSVYDAQRAQRVCVSTLSMWSNDHFTREHSRPVRSNSNKISCFGSINRQ